jgi:hypothetical protein
MQPILARYKWLNRSYLDRLWLAAALAAGAAALCPINCTLVRTGLIGAATVALLYPALLFWHHGAVRLAAAVVALLLLALFFMPGQEMDVERVRVRYLAALRAYDGTPYLPGGENPIGIDCSGLVRRSLIDALAAEGLNTGNPAALREALSLWWHDMSAKALLHADDLVTRLGNASSLNEVDTHALLPGDLAVSRSGQHVLAYLGEQHWTFADPQTGAVHIVRSPSAASAWFKEPVALVRWSMF